MRLKEVSEHSGENLGKLRAEQFFFYPLVMCPDDWKEERAAWQAERSGVQSII